MRRLLIDGSVRDDGLPVVFPARAYVPAWAGGTRPSPGQSTNWMGDLLGGVERHRQLPRTSYGGPYQPPCDVGILGRPRTQIGRRGVILERSRANVLSSGNWDFSTWTATNCSVVAGQVGPTGLATGTSQAYGLADSASGGERALSGVAVSNMNANTYVWSVWARALAGTTPTMRLTLRSGASSVNKDWLLGDDWRHCWVTSPNVNSTSVDLHVFPAGPSASGTVLLWGPVLELSVAAAGKTDAGRGSTVDGGGTRLRTLLDGPHVWPPPPWTLFLHFAPFWGVTDGLAHRIFEAYTTSGTPLLAVTKSTGSTLQALLRDRRAGSQVAFTTPDTSVYVHERDWRVVVKLTEEGALSGWLDGEEFSDQVAAPAALPDANGPKRLLLGDGSTTVGEADCLLHRLELWDEDLEPERFF